MNDDAVRVAVGAGVIAFALLIFVPIASLLIRALLWAGLVGLAVFVVMRLFGR